MSEKPKVPREYTQAQVAKRLGVSVTQVRRWREEGRLNGEERDGAVWYSADEVDALADELNLKQGGAIAVLPRLMDHVEALHKARLGVADDYRAQITVFREENEKLRTRVDALETKHLDVLKTFEELATQRHKREMERERFEVETGFKRTIVEKVSLLAPAVVNRLAGKNLLPTEDTRMLALEALAETLTPAQITAVRSAVSNEQAAVLLDLLDVAKQNAKARASAADAAAGRAPKGEPAKVVDVEAEAAGDGAARAAS